MSPETLERIAETACPNCGAGKPRYGQDMHVARREPCRTPKDRRVYKLHDERIIAAVVLRLDDERLDPTGDGVWGYLKPGWCWDDPGCHTIHERLMRDFRKALRRVRPCDCDQCQSTTRTG